MPELVIKSLVDTKLSLRKHLNKVCWEPTNSKERVAPIQELPMGTCINYILQQRICECVGASMVLASTKQRRISDLWNEGTE